MAVGDLSTAAIDTNGTIYVGSDDKYLYAIKNNGSLKWRYRTSGSISSSPVGSFQITGNLRVKA